MKPLLIVLVLAGLLGGMTIWASADEVTARDVHRGTGIVISLSPSEITLKEGDERHRMTLEKSTRILITSEDRVRQLGIGDYVAEECVPDGKGGIMAIKLTLYRPAWMENASPEN